MQSDSEQTHPNFAQPKAESLEPYDKPRKSEQFVFGDPVLN
jgi:hypothetical protein